ncbi:hypothetical protein EVAR_62644_1 [Eumeta japonica]|uniref:Uncharacterized protein n=1 Tax=Eumeta variegata TaxID=151549 RepID=A0A4C1ZEG2_EUMVA|nr:hypothetical protein EVAR_62644_1 [Eumeta japonica]
MICAGASNYECTSAAREHIARDAIYCVRFVYFVNLCYPQTQIVDVKEIPRHSSRSIVRPSSEGSKDLDPDSDRPRFLIQIEFYSGRYERVKQQYREMYNKNGNHRRSINPIRGDKSRPSRRRPGRPDARADN